MFNDERAYTPFYCDVCQYSAKRPRNRVLRAAVNCNANDAGLQDPSSDMSCGSAVRAVYISIRPAAWPWEGSFSPQVGDGVEIKNLSFVGSVEAVAKGCDGAYVLTCRGA